MDERKKVAIWFGMIYPNKFFEKLKNFKVDTNKNVSIELFRGSYVLAAAVFFSETFKDDKDKFLEKAFNDFKFECTKKLDGIHYYNEAEVQEAVKRVSEYQKNGVWDTSYYFWFIRNVAVVNSIFAENVGNIELSFNQVNFKNEKDKIFKSFMFASSDKDLMMQPQLNALCDVTNYRIRAWLSKMTKPQKSVRTPITTSLRIEVFKSNGYKCVICGATKDDSPLEVDHKIPISRGGTDELSNLQTLCKACNLSKKHRILES